MAAINNNTDPKDLAGTPINTLNVPEGTSDVIINSIISAIPGILSFLKKEEPPRQENFIPYYLLGGVLLVVLLTNKK